MEETISEPACEHTPGLEDVLTLLQSEFKQLQHALRQDIRGEVRDCLALEIRTILGQQRPPGLQSPTKLGSSGMPLLGAIISDPKAGSPLSPTYDRTNVVVDAANGPGSCELTDFEQTEVNYPTPPRHYRKCQVEPIEVDSPPAKVPLGTCQRPLLVQEPRHVPMSHLAQEYAMQFSNAQAKKKPNATVVEKVPCLPKQQPRLRCVPPSTPPPMPMIVQDMQLGPEHCTTPLSSPSGRRLQGHSLRSAANVDTLPNSVFDSDDSIGTLARSPSVLLGTCQSPKSSEAGSVEAWATRSPLKKRITSMTFSQEDSPEHSPSKTLASNLARKSANHASPKNMERAMGLTSCSARVGFEHASTLRQLASKLVYSAYFDHASLACIFLNAIVIGFHTNHAAENLGSREPVSYRVLEVGFCCLFTLELVVRIFVHGQRFFVGWGWAWNMLDFLLVSVQFGGECLRVLGQIDSMFQSAFVLRCVRLCRSLRVIRTLHITRVSNELRMLLSCLMHALSTFFWAITMLFLLTYIMGILLTDATLSTRSKLDTSAQSFKDLTTWYGSVPRTLISLFQAFSGGVDWNDLSEPLIADVSPWWGMWFLVYIAFIFFAVNNLVTAIFVETAIERAEVVKEKQKMNRAWKLFQHLDGDASGFITREEMRDHLTEPAIQEYFKSIDLDVSELDTLFRILDMDGSGEVEFSEFMNGCLRLQGSAKSLDVLLIMQEMRSSFKQLADGLGEIQTTVVESHRQTIGSSRNKSGYITGYC